MVRDYFSCLSMADICVYYNRAFLSCILIFLLLSGQSLQCGPGRGSVRRPHSRKRTPLVFQQHVPSVSENTLGASGPPEGQITRNDERFKELAENFNPDIIFKDQEGSGADRRMSHRCKDKLNTLAIAVMNQWPGIKLRVVEAWDEDGIHGKNSLHYEGRAVDITTSDRDHSKYGMLARLAVEAGFDWVYYESRRYIHCSVASDSSAVVKIGGCFPGKSLVLLETGEKKTLSTLQIGEKVQSVNENGQEEFSPVIAFLDKQSNPQVLFYTLHLEDRRSIRLTGKHLVFVNNNNTTTDFQAIFAENVKQGQYVYVLDNSEVKSHFRPTKVSQISLETHSGMYAPLTSTGTIVLDGVLLSCYAYTENVALAHAGFAPMRLFYTIANSLPFDLWTQHTDKEGIHWYAQLLYRLGEMTLSDGLLHSPFSP